MHAPVIAYRADIDGLRAVAVLAVVIFHAKLGLFPGGFVGVDIFFVISGFLIASIIVKEHERGAFSIARFYERRIRRIFPALLTVVLATAALGWFVLAPGDYMSFARSAMAAMAFYSNFFFNRQAGYFAPAAETQPLLHTWSLGVEEQFYLLAPLILLALLGPLKRWRAAIFWALFAASLGISVFGVMREASWAFYLPHSRAFELMAGVALALGLVPALTSQRVAEGAAWGGLALIVGGVCLFTATTPFPGIAALVPVLGAVLIIHAGARHETWAGRLLASAPTVFTGKISYSLYLWHWPLLALAEYEWGAALTAWHRLALMALAIALSVLTYHFIEQPARRTTPLLTRRTVFAFGAASIVLCLAMSQTIIRTRGLPIRLAPDVAEFARAMPNKLDTGGLCGFDAGRGKSETVRDCPIGETTIRQPRFILLGDSHAAALSVDFARAAKAKGIMGYNYGRGGCPPLLGLRDGGGVLCSYLAPGRRIEALLKDPQITDVILHGRWGLYAEGEASANEPNTRPRQFDASNKEANRAAFGKVLRGTVEKIRAAGKRVTILGPVPELEINLPAAMIKAKMRGLSPDLSLARGKFDQRQVGVMPILHDLEKIEGVRVLYPHELLCDGQTCRTESGGKALYFDDDHLSPAGSALIRPMIENAIKPVMPIK